MEPAIVSSAETPSGQLANWRTKSFGLINLRPLEDAIQNSLQKWLVSQDEQSIQDWLYF